ncbi:hypothetical protein [Chlamydiifrater volucris]|uniref:hypothetical protein n=1 Tax=Chlamydiifrater volucris TaxID=2681470 RepID=UPI001BCC01B9|nr:hypothetical protein [Chlamydiifrater volucris]
MLLQYTTKEALASALKHNIEVQKTFLRARSFNNLQLARILLACDISDDICLPKGPNPKGHVEILECLYSLVNEGPQSSFVQIIQTIWRNADPTILSSYSFKIASDSKGLNIQDIPVYAAPQLIPDVKRYYPSKDKNSGLIIFTERPMTSYFAKFLATVVLTTLQAILDNQEFQASLRDLFVKSPEGEWVPSMKLFLKICSLVLLSTNTWKTFSTPCKASVLTKEPLSFEPEAINSLEKNLLNFTKTNYIRLIGSEIF